MAFEDRSSPNTATSPANECLNLNAPNSPESTRTSPYTCTTILTNQQEDKKDFIIRSSSAVMGRYSPNTPYPRSPSTDSMVSCNPSESSSSPPPQRNQDEEPTIQTLKYSIRNILQPDFGKNALIKTKSSPKINFKPYETSEKFGQAPLGSLCQTVSQIGKTQETPTTQKIPEAKSLTTIETDTKTEEGKVPTLWPAWVYCTRYSDRPSSVKTFT
ncbi:hypothetical protein QE152_g8231 [Popillia japonica]|uniref:Engrailed n=1 Tax=Popillia japonica TaxID=7064 RepID=A0AAW1MC27_POPJA